MSEMTAPVIRWPWEMRRHLAARAAELQLSRATLDDVAKLPDGYSTKLLSEPHTKELSWNSFWALVGALGFAVVLVEDKQRRIKVDALTKRIATFDGKAHWRDAKALGIMLERARETGSKGGLARWAGTTPEQRAKALRRVALMGHRKRRNGAQSGSLPKVK